MQESTMDEKERMSKIVIVKSIWGNIHSINISQGLCVSHTCAGGVHSKNHASPYLQGEVKLEEVK